MYQCRLPVQQGSLEKTSGLFSMGVHSLGIIAASYYSPFTLRMHGVFLVTFLSFTQLCCTWYHFVALKNPMYGKVHSQPERTIGDSVNKAMQTCTQ